MSEGMQGEMANTGPLAEAAHQSPPLLERVTDLDVLSVIGQLHEDIRHINRPGLPPPDQRLGQDIINTLPPHPWFAASPLSVGQPEPHFFQIDIFPT